MTLSKKTRKKAFTFLEILVVLTLLVVFAGVALPRIKGNFYHFQTEGFANRLVNLFEYLRLRSVTEEETFRVTIDGDAKTIRTRVSESDRTLKTLRIPASLTLTSDKQEIFFYPDGTIDGVTIELRSPDAREIKLTTEGVWSGIKLVF